LVGPIVGDTVGVKVGYAVGDAVGSAVGASVGVSDGDCVVGSGVGTMVGAIVTRIQILLPPIVPFVPFGLSLKYTEPTKFGCWKQPPMKFVSFVRLMPYVLPGKYAEISSHCS
jgi:hypothetical protein